MITAETRDMWQSLADNAAAQRPYAGRRVRVDGGRKHKGRFGTVTRHEHDRFSHAYRYGNDAHLHMLDLKGRYGWAVLVRDDMGAKFWVRADYVTVIDGTEVSE